MSKRFLLAILLLICFALPLNQTHAELSDERRAELLAIIAALTTQVTELQAQLTDQSDTGPDLQRNLYIGTEGADVEELQRFLRRTGDFTYPEITGYYGTVTEQAVQRFQCREMQICSGSANLNGYGVVGPLTRGVVRNYRFVGTDAGGAADGSGSGSEASGGSDSTGGGSSGVGVAGSQSCSFDGQSVVHGGSVTAYQTASVPHGSSCQSQTRSCSDGTLSGAYTFGSCLVEEATFDGYDIVIVGGQSNAVGAGFGTFSDPYASTEIDAKIFQLGRYAASEDEVVPATWSDDTGVYDALQHWNVTINTKNVGPGLTFARRYATNDLDNDRRVLIVPAAYGGSSILKWLGDINEPVTVPVALYDDLEDKVDIALDLPGDNEIVAFIWHQGESDVSNAASDLHGMTPAVYEDKLEELLDQLRDDFPSSPRYPVIGGKFVPAWPEAWGAADIMIPIKEQVEEAISDVFDSDALGGAVDSVGLSANYPGLTTEISQQVHFSSAAQITLGDRYYQKWLELMQDDDDDVVPPADPAEISITAPAAQSTLDSANTYNLIIDHTDVPDEAFRSTFVIDAVSSQNVALEVDEAISSGDFTSQISWDIDDVGLPGSGSLPGTYYVLTNLKDAGGNLLHDNARAVRTYTIE